MCMDVQVGRWGVGGECGGGVCGGCMWGVYVDMLMYAN